MSTALDHRETSPSSVPKEQPSTVEANNAWQVEVRRVVREMIHNVKGVLRSCIRLSLLKRISSKSPDTTAEEAHKRVEQCLDHCDESVQSAAIAIVDEGAGDLQDVELGPIAESIVDELEPSLMDTAVSL